MTVTIHPTESLAPLEREGLSRRETAQVLGIGVTKLHELMRDGRIRVVKIGSRTIVPRDEIRRFLMPRN